MCPCGIFEVSLHTRLPLRRAVTCASLSGFLSFGTHTKKTVSRTLHASTCVQAISWESAQSQGHLVAVVQQVIRSPVWYAEGLQCQNRNLQFLHCLYPKERNEPYLAGRWPSISNFSQFISLPKSKRTMMSGINQMLTPHIQDWDMQPFLPAQNLFIVLLRLPGSRFKPFWLPCANIWQLEDCAGAMSKDHRVERAEAVHWKSKKQRAETPVPRPHHYSFILANVLQGCS